MNSIRQQRLFVHAALTIALLCLIMGSACRDSGSFTGEVREEAQRADAQIRQESAEKPAGSVRQWTQIELVDHYSLRGDVIEDEDLSGIARLSDKYFLIGADEGRAVQVVELSGPSKSLRVVKSISLARTGEEIDIEAIAAEGGWCYVIGSHGVSKKQGQRQENRYKIFRLKVDRETGTPADAEAEAASLWDAIGADTVLGEHFQRPLQQRGVNIEGLAVRDGKLFVGFRGPNLGGYAFVMEIAAADIFGGTPTAASAGGPQANHVLHKLKLGQGFGIREIVAAKAGFLIIAGNSSSEPSERFTQAVDYDEDREFLMFLWDSGNPDVHRIGTIPGVTGKAEAMTILNESSDEVTVLVLFDGPKGGQPSIYRIQ